MNAPERDIAARVDVGFAVPHRPVCGTRAIHGETPRHTLGVIFPDPA